MRVLDAGCGGGRNVVYLLQAGFEVWAADPSAEAVDAVRGLAVTLGQPFADGRVRQEPIEAMTFEPGSFDVVIASAVLHFARDHAHFDAMVDGLWRVLAPGGLLFARLASDRGFEGRLRPLGGGRAILPDGSERYVVSERQLEETTRRLGGTLDDPLKTTVVQEQRAMTTWVVRKGR
jgi:SAM-dependent methyltransferase